MGTPQNLAASDAVIAGNLEVRPSERMALVDGAPLSLTVREFQVLVELSARAGRIVSREDLYAQIWQMPFHSDERSVDVYVAKLRNKLEAASPQWRFIHTHVGFGYRFSSEPSHPFHSPGTGR